MKKIKNKSQLEEEKLRLRVTQLELENKLRRDWVEVKESMEPKKIFQNAFHLEAGRKNSLGDWLLRGLHVAASSLVSSVLHRAEHQAGKQVDHVMEKASQFFSRKGGKRSFNKGFDEHKN